MFEATKSGSIAATAAAKELARLRSGLVSLHPISCSQRRQYLTGVAPDARAIPLIWAGSGTGGADRCGVISQSYF